MSDQREQFEKYSVEVLKWRIDDRNDPYVKGQNERDWRIWQAAQAQQQAELSRLTAENERLKEEIETLNITVYSWRVKVDELTDKNAQLKAQGAQEPYGYIEPDGKIISPWNNQPYHIPVYLVRGGRK